MSDRAHYLRRLTGDRWPRRMIYLDSEAVQAGDGVFVFQLACGLVSEPDGRGGWTFLDPGNDLFTAEEDLWEWVDRWAAPRGETRVWMHGLEFDLAVTRARSNLVRLGWRPERFAIREHAGWWRWRRGDRILSLCDSSGFLGNASIATVAKDLGVEQADRSDPVARCRGDVWILFQAMMRVFAWYQEEEFGSLQLSGASQGMAAYRHRWLPEREILCHADEGARAAEREATWAGRCEAWRWGRVTGPLEEWDFELCYPAIAAGDVPVRLVSPSHGPEDGFTRLTRVLVDTDVPVVPVGSRRGVVFPVGRFETVLWGPEIDLAISEGAYVEAREWPHRYQLGRPLQEWSEWIRDQATNHPSPLARRITKQWSRTVIGSFGLRYPTWDLWGEDDGEETVRVIPWTDGQHDSRMLQLGGATYLEGDLVESENACPQIQSYVWSVARCWLWRAMRRAGLENVVYVDTDSLIVTQAGADRLRVWNMPNEVHMPRLRLKARYPWAEIYGSRQLILPEGERISGLKRGAVRTGPATWEAEVWDTPAGGLGGADQARAVRRRFTLRRGELRRDRQPGGLTKAVKL